MIWYEVRLHYHSTAKYKDFISSINVQWGYYVQDSQGKWEKVGRIPGKEAPKQVSKGVDPPKFDVEKININEEPDPDKVHKALKIPTSKAQLIIEEREKNGKYFDYDHIFDRVKDLEKEQDTIIHSYNEGNFDF